MKRFALIAALALAAPNAARADEPVAELLRAGPVAAYGGWKAWSAYDESSRTYKLMLQAPDGTIDPPSVHDSSTPYDVSLGPHGRAGVVAVYRDVSGIHLHEVRGRDVLLRSVDSPYQVESNPAIWRSTVVFTRRFRGCDVPYVKTLGSAKPSRRLLKKKCLQTPPGHTSIRGSRIVISSVDRTGADANGAGRKVSEVRKYLTTRRGSSVLLRQAFGEEANLFGQVAQDATRVYTVRTGTNDANTFVRVTAGGTRHEEVRAFRSLTGAFAKPSANESIYVEQPTSETECTGEVRVPCRVVLSPHLPFGGLQRTLTPELTVAYEGQPRRGQPLTFTGRLTRRIVAGDKEVRTEPLPGVTVELYHRSRTFPETFTPTGDRGVTGADGGYSIVVPSVGDDPWYTAVASTQPIATWAGRGTVGSVTR